MLGVLRLLAPADASLLVELIEEEEEKALVRCHAGCVFEPVDTLTKDPIMYLGRAPSLSGLQTTKPSCVLPLRRNVVSLRQASVGIAACGIALLACASPGFAQSVLWRFRMETDYVPHRPAVGLDGTVYVADLHARLYALHPEDGTLLWSFDAALGTPSLSEGPVAVTPDGTIVVAANPLGQNTNLVAVNPDGTLRWVHTDCCSQGCIAGPNVGPDGHVYAVFDLGGAGVVSLTQAGEVRWETTGSPVVWEYGAVGAELAFGRSIAEGAVDQLVMAFDRDAEDDHLWATGIDGAQNFAVTTSGTHSVFGQFQAQPAAGPDGTIYLCEFSGISGWGLQAFASGDGHRVWRFDPGIISTVTPPDVGPDGMIYFSRDLSRLHSVRPGGTGAWEYLSPGVIDRGPIVSPTNDMVVFCGRQDFGAPGTVSAVSTAGVPLWSLTLPDEAGGHLTPSTRALFRGDGRVVYVGVDNLGQTIGEPYCYLYAISTGCPSPRSYCVAAPNSAGPGAYIGHAGSTSIEQNDFTLRVRGGIPGQFGISFYGGVETQLPFGDGFRCVGGAIFRLRPPQLADANGESSRLVDFTQPPAGSGAGEIEPGSSWKFQHWYRDPAFGGSGFNLSDALSVVFCP